MLKRSERVETDLLSLAFPISYTVFKNKILINEAPGGCPHIWPLPQVQDKYSLVRDFSTICWLKSRGLCGDLLSEYSCLLQMNEIKIGTALRHKKKKCKRILYGHTYGKNKHNTKSPNICTPAKHNPSMLMSHTKMRIEFFCCCFLIH